MKSESRKACLRCAVYRLAAEILIRENAGPWADRPLRAAGDGQDDIGARSCE